MHRAMEVMGCLALRLTPLSGATSEDRPNRAYAVRLDLPGARVEDGAWHEGAST